MERTNVMNFGQMNIIPKKKKTVNEKFQLSELRDAHLANVTSADY